MMEATEKTVALNDGNTTYYLTPTKRHYYGQTIATWTTAAGDPLTPVNHRKATGWMQAPGGVQDLTCTVNRPPNIVGWELRDPGMQSAKLPATLTADEFTNLDLDEEVKDNLYRPVTEPSPGETSVVRATDMIVIDDAAPAPDDGLVWVPNLRNELRQHPAVHHLFPGELTGFRQAVVDAVNALPFINARILGEGARVDSGNPHCVQVSRRVPYEPHHTRKVREIGVSGRPLKRFREVVEEKTLSVTLRVPDRIAGEDRAQARRRWDEELARVVGVLSEAVTEAPCWHCQGTGVVSVSEAKAAAAG